MNNITCDLHLHSNYSDGEKDPLDLIQIAKLAKLKIFSITDHNAISNRVEEVKNESEKQGIKFIEGIEISSFDIKNKRSFHILGYSNKFNLEALEEGLKETLQGYENRAQKILANLRKGNSKIKITYGELLKKSKSVYVGRNHIASYLVNQLPGLTFKKAMELAYIDEVESWMMTPDETIRLIKKCGGKAVLAHPRNIISTLRNTLNEFKESGIDGVEAITFKATPREIRIIKRIADDLKLSITAGSDWHGKNSTPNIKIGFNVDSHVLNWLIQN
jgi:predicted metal-dependent phosphoesterase TrpH